ncbi:MAG: hypothetical protein J3Q66DRAFT_375471 [Benniella sp.]|nr:MAG: hypothetical protein J3Q66DRAFT_375471 [Benniella sp.]
MEDISSGMFDSAQFEGTDLRQTILRGAWLLIINTRFDYHCRFPLDFLSKNRTDNHGVMEAGRQSIQEAYEQQADVHIAMCHVIQTRKGHIDLGLQPESRCLRWGLDRLLIGLQAPEPRIPGSISLFACAGALTAFSSVFKLQNPGSQDQPSFSKQYLLIDERTPKAGALTFGCPTTPATSKLSIPFWQPGGGLSCTGNKSEDNVHEKCQIGSPGTTWRRLRDRGWGGCTASGRHPIFRNTTRLDIWYRGRRLLALRHRYSGSLKRNSDNNLLFLRKANDKGRDEGGQNKGSKG